MEIQEIYQRYVNDVYRYLFSLCKDRPLAEDLTQETFLKVFGVFDESMPVSLKAWLFKVAYHTFIDYLRKNKNIQLEPTDMISELEAESSAEVYVVKKDEKENLYQQLDLLKPAHKKAILLVDLSGYSLQEAALKMDVNVNTLKSYLFRGRGKLKTLMKKGREQDE